MEMLSSTGWLTLVGAVVGLVGVIALPVALLLTLAIVRLFKRKVIRLMRAAATAAAPVRLDAADAMQGSLDELVLDVLTEDGPPAEPATYGWARRHTRRLAWIYAAAMATHAAFCTALMLLLAQLRPSLLGVVSLFLMFGAPVPLAMILVSWPRMRYLVLASILWFVVLFIFDKLAGLDTVGLWLYVGATPLLAVLLLNVRRLRAVGPLVFAAAILVIGGWIAGTLLALGMLLDDIGPMYFVDPELASLSYSEATTRLIDKFGRLPFEQMLAQIGALLDEPQRFVAMAHAERLTPAGTARFHLLWVSATLFATGLAWLLLAWVARRYRARRASDQMLTVDALTIVFTLYYAFTFVAAYQAQGAMVVLAFLGYKAVVDLSLQRVRASESIRLPRTLLLLRVFGFERRTQTLLDELSLGWRPIGPICLIAGADLAEVSLEPHEFFDFLNGRLSREFIMWPDVALVDLSSERFGCLSEMSSRTSPNKNRRADCTFTCTRIRPRNRE